MSQRINLGQMIGGRILDVQSCVWGSPSDPPVPPVTVLIIRLEDGQTVQAEVWQDAEGNGPGFLSVETTE